MLTKQEMFDKAWHGLASQKWQRSYDYVEDLCVYATHDAAGAVTMRCAWGWVDPEGTERAGITSVRKLAADGVGLAARLPFEDLLFAQALQNAHDEGRNGPEMQQAFRELAIDNGLKVPE